MVPTTNAPSYKRIDTLNHLFWILLGPYVNLEYPSTSRLVWLKDGDDVDFHVYLISKP